MQSPGKPGVRRHTAVVDPIFRHLAACNNAVLPGNRVPLHLSGRLAGYMDPPLLPELLKLGAQSAAGVVTLDPLHLPDVAHALAEAGHYRWRGEPFDVQEVDPVDGSPVLATIDRGALPAFGIGAVGVHLNALVHRPEGLHLWVARRAKDKLLDPGKLDHLVAGGVPAGLTPAQTLAKEAEEEAGLDAPLLRDAVHVATIDYAMARPEGLRRDRLHCYDVALSPSFTPEARDGEVEAFELWPLPHVLDRVRHSDDFKFNVNLVLIDLFQRQGLLGPSPG